LAADRLSQEQIEKLLSQSKFRDAIKPIDAALASQLTEDEKSFVDLTAFDSAQDFVARGVGFCLEMEGRIVAAAYSSLVCSRGIEVSIFVEHKYREHGVATALASKLALYCLRRGEDLESCKLAEKLGYRRSGTYTAYYREE
jgi:GNAT superfamily N-acetyltransferase